MALRPEMSMATGLTVATLVYSLYSRQLPPSVDLRVSDQGDADAEAARKQAVWASAAVVSGISLLTRDASVFIIGASMVIVLDWSARANIWTNPITKTAKLLDREDQAMPTQAMDEDLYGPAMV